MSIELILFALARWPLLCGLTLLAFIFGLRKLARGNRTGWMLLAAGLLMPGYYGAQWAQTKLTPAQRVKEIASWPRVTVNAANRSRVLIVRGYGDTPQPFVYFLAETGLFDVFAVNGLDVRPAPRKIWRIETGLRDNCAKDRNLRDEMVVLTGWRSCASAVPAESVPHDGLILYTMGTLAPHSWTTTRKDFNTEAVWTLELALRAGDVEQLVAYDEFVAFPEMRFNAVVGPVLGPRGPPRRQVAINGTDIVSPELAGFVLTALGIDERSIVPPSALSLDEQRATVDRLSATNQPEDTQRALDLIAAAPADPAFQASMGRFAANPATSLQMQLKHQPRWCEKIERLLRYREALSEACASSSVATDKCGRLGSSVQWLGLCADNSEPIWRGNDKPARRIFIADVLGGQKTGVLLPRPAVSNEVRIPADRGPLDIVIRNQSPRIFVFTGAASCIERLTILDPASNSGTGVVGAAASRVRFVAPVGSGSWINPSAPFSGDMATILGIKPDTLLFNHDGDIDLADSIAPDRSAAPCAQTSNAPLQSGGTLRIDTSQILTVPPLLPFVRKDGVNP